MESFHRHALPEGHAALDQMGLGLGLGVEPDSLGQHVAVDHERVVMRLALPGAGGLVVAESDVLALERAFGEVVVTLHQHGVVTLGDDGVVPSGFHGVPFKFSAEAPSFCQMPVACNF